MKQREVFIAELWSRLASIPGIVFTARNPSMPPNVDDLPAVQFFEMEDIVESTAKRTGVPISKRTVQVIVELYTTGTSESASTAELSLLVNALKTAIFSDGDTLGKTCAEISEVSMTRVFRPPVGSNVAGIGITFNIRYIDDVSKY